MAFLPVTDRPDSKLPKNCRTARFIRRAGGIPGLAFDIGIAKVRGNVLAIRWGGGIITLDDVRANKDRRYVYVGRGHFAEVIG
jgi:hypothetical protein